CATPTAISCLTLAGSAPSAKTRLLNAVKASWMSGASFLRVAASSGVDCGKTSFDMVVLSSFSDPGALRVEPGRRRDARRRSRDAARRTGRTDGASKIYPPYTFARTRRAARPPCTRRHIEHGPLRIAEVDPHLPDRGRDRAQAEPRIRTRGPRTARDAGDRTLVRRSSRGARGGGARVLGQTLRHETTPPDAARPAVRDRAPRRRRRARGCGHGRAAASRGGAAAQRGAVRLGSGRRASHIRSGDQTRPRCPRGALDEWALPST